MAKTFDVGIIGGGIIGCAVAYYLSKVGASVIVLEKNHICSGASGANQGGMPFQIFDPKTLPLLSASCELYRGLSEELRFDIEYRENGSILVARHAYQVPLLKRRYNELIDTGFDIELWDNKKLRRFPGGDAEPFLAVVESHSDGQVNPLRATYAFAFGAKRRGAVIREAAPVVHIRIRGRKVHFVVLEGGEEVSCGHVVCAAGAWSRQIGKMVGIDIPIEPQRGQLIITEQVTTSEYQYILDADYLTTAYGLEVESEDEAASERFSMGIGASYVQEPAGNWIIGSSRDQVGLVTATSPEVLRAMARHLLKFLPVLENVNCIRFIAGCRPYCVEDGLPILGRVSGLPGFHIATGHGGEGVGLAPITGKLIADEITTGEASPLLGNFWYERFTPPSIIVSC